MSLLLRISGLVLAIAPVIVVAILASVVAAISGIVKAALDGKISKAEQKNISDSSFALVWELLRKIPYLDVK